MPLAVVGAAATSALPLPFVDGGVQVQQGRGRPWQLGWLRIQYQTGSGVPMVEVATSGTTLLSAPCHACVLHALPPSAPERLLESRGVEVPRRYALRHNGTLLPDLLLLHAAPTHLEAEVNRRGLRVAPLV